MLFQEIRKEIQNGNVIDFSKLITKKTNETEQMEYHVAAKKAAEIAKDQNLKLMRASFKGPKKMEGSLVVMNSVIFNITKNHPQFVKYIKGTIFCIMCESKLA